MIEETKRCPDCAETVLAAARKCRYCGYRFDRRSGDAGLLGGSARRPPPAPRTLEELLGDWGEYLHEDERPGSITFTELDGIDGYLLVTGRRVAFFGPPPEERRTGVIGLLRPQALRKLVELALDELVSVEVDRWPRARLTVRGRGETLIFGGLTGAQARGLHARLTTIVPPGP